MNAEPPLLAVTVRFAVSTMSREPVPLPIKELVELSTTVGAVMVPPRRLPLLVTSNVPAADDEPTKVRFADEAFKNTEPLSEMAVIWLGWVLKATLRSNLLPVLKPMFAVPVACRVRAPPLFKVPLMEPPPLVRK